MPKPRDQKMRVMRMHVVDKDGYLNKTPHASKSPKAGAAVANKLPPTAAATGVAVKAEETEVRESGAEVGAEVRSEVEKKDAKEGRPDGEESSAAAAGEAAPAKPEEGEGKADNAGRPADVEGRDADEQPEERVTLVGLVIPEAAVTHIVT